MQPNYSKGHAKVTLTCTRRRDAMANLTRFLCSFHRTIQQTDAHLNHSPLIASLKAFVYLSTLADGVDDCGATEAAQMTRENKSNVCRL